MLQYFQIGITIFVLWCLCIPMLRRAPSRLKFYLTLLSVVVWLVPWHNVKLDIPLLSTTSLGAATGEKVLHINEIVEKINLPNSENDARSKKANNLSLLDSRNQTVAKPNVLGTFSKHIVAYIAAGYQSIILCAFLLGFIIFALDWLRFRICIAQWLASSKNSDHLAVEFGLDLKNASVRTITHGSPGMATGLRRPIIWLSENIENQEHQKAIILHELMHIEQGDIYWLWLINFCKRLLWWNPVALLLIRQALNYMEYSCDERCNKRLVDFEYRENLAELIVDQARVKTLDTVLGFYKGGSLNVQRIKSLGEERQLGYFQLGFLCLAVPMALMLCLVVLSEERKFLDPSAFLTIPLTFEDLDAKVDVSSPERELFEFASAIRANDLNTAESIHHRLLSAFLEDDLAQTYNIASRARTFRVMAMYLAKNGQDRSIIDTYNEILPKRVQYSDTHLSRIMAITNIRLGNYDEAIDILEKADAIRLRLGPSTALLAQAYHLKGDYLNSIKVVENQLSFFERRKNYYHSRISALRILGKNYALLNNAEGVALASKRLQQYKPRDFLELDLSIVEIPDVYFEYRSVAGIKVSTNNERRIPLPDRPRLTGDKPLDTFLTAASIYGRYREFGKAEKIVLEGLSEFDDRIVAQDKIKILEYLFIIQILTEKVAAAEITARTLLKHEEVHPEIAARLKNLLSVAKLSKSTNHDTSRGADVIKFQIDEKKSLTAAHETIKVYSGAVNSEPAEAAAAKILEFYQQNAVIPDIKTLNSMIGLFENLGKTEDAAKLRGLLVEAYPRAYNFIFQDFGKNSNHREHRGA